MTPNACGHSKKTGGSGQHDWKGGGGGPTKTTAGAQVPQAQASQEPASLAMRQLVLALMGIRLPGKHGHAKQGWRVRHRKSHPPHAVHRLAARGTCEPSNRNWVEDDTATACTGIDLSACSSRHQMRPPPPPTRAPSRRSGGRRLHAHKPRYSFPPPVRPEMFLCSPLFQNASRARMQLCMCMHTIRRGPRISSRICIVEMAGGARAGAPFYFLPNPDQPRQPASPSSRSHRPRAGSTKRTAEPPWVRRALG